MVKLHLGEIFLVAKGAARKGKQGRRINLPRGKLATIETTELRPGYSISRMLKGGWQLSGDHGPVETSRAIADMIRYVDLGITAFDCADIYTGVEKMISVFRRKLVDLRGEAALQPIKVHTKYVPDRASLKTLGLKDVEAAIDRSLTRLKQERLDLVQFHWWDFDVPRYLDAVGYLVRLREAGKIDLIGVTNFDATRLAELCEVTDIASAQVQYSLLDRRASGAFSEVASANNVGLISYGTLAGGFLTDTWLGRPDPGFEFENRSLVKYRLIIDEFGGWDLFQALLRAMRRIANANDTDIATVSLWSNLDSKDVKAAIVGARYADRLASTLRAFELNPTVEDRQALGNVLAEHRGPFGNVYELERDISGRHGRIMKYNLNSGDGGKAQDLTAGGET